MSSTGPQIRPMIPEDIHDVVQMIGALSAFHNDTAAVTAETITRDTNPVAPWMHVFVAEQDAKLVGYMILLPLTKVADGLRGIDINHMYVAEPHRGTGIARAFISAASAKARSLQASYMFVSTAPENTDAQAAYRACGFTDWPSGSPRFRLQL